MYRLAFTQPVPGAQKAAEGYRLEWRRPALMGVVNVTPDSFSDGGLYADSEAAIRHAEALLEAGALVVDVGGESTRPGAEPVEEAAELDRVLPVIKWLRRETSALISIDSYKPEVVAAALRAGAHLVNDVTGLRHPEMRSLCAVWGVPAVIMHMQGEPRTMQHNPRYEDVVGEVFGFLATQAGRALAAGIPSVMLDPGIGFGKRLEHNLALIRHLDRLVAYGHPVLLGASRKRLIELIAGPSEAAARDPGTLALHLYGLQRGTAMLRVHNVAAHRQALLVWEALHG